jgi:hypothetical protein
MSSFGQIDPSKKLAAETAGLGDLLVRILNENTETGSLKQFAGQDGTSADSLRSRLSR